MPDVSPPPADDERIPPLTAQQLGLCGPRSDDPGVGPDAARHTPPADDQAARAEAFERSEAYAAHTDPGGQPTDLAAVESYWRDVASRKVGSTNYWGLPVLLAEYDRLARAEQSLTEHWYRDRDRMLQAESRAAAVRALADELDTANEPAGETLRAVLDGPTEAPAPMVENTTMCGWSDDGRHRWGLGRDKNECADCDAPKWIAGPAEAAAPARSPIEVAERAMFARRDAARQAAEAGAPEPALAAAARLVLAEWSRMHPSGYLAMYPAMDALRAALATTLVEAVLIGTWADPEFRAHADHKHAVDGCGFCPSEEDR